MGTVCFKQKSNICNAKFEDWGLVGTLICLLTMQLFRAMMTIKGQGHF